MNDLHAYVQGVAMNNITAASSPRESLPLQAGLLEANLTIFWLLFAAALVFFQQVRSLPALATAAESAGAFRVWHASVSGVP